MPDSITNALTLQTPFSDLLDRYEKEYLEFEGRELRVNRNRLDHLRRELGSHQVLTNSDIDRFTHIYSDRTPSTRNRYRALLKHVLRWGQQRGLVEGTVPVDLLRVERENGERTRRLSPEEETQLILAMDSDLRDLFYAALDTGLRRGALLKLKFKDVQAGVLVVPAHIQKHRQSQRIPLTKRLAEIVQHRWDMFPVKDHLIFNGKRFREHWDSARRKAGCPDLHWHDLRGEFASRLDEAGVEVSVTSRLLGHSSLNTTQRYLRPRVERFKDAIDRLGV